MSRYYLEPIIEKRSQAHGIALKAFVKTSGDTIGVVHVMVDGGFVFWREGSCIGTFDTVKALYEKCEEVDVP
jgi:folate-dependent phosphoribosylglycinamide formyltransferase PurN